MSDRKCPGCGGKISRGARLCATCRKTAIAVGVDVITHWVRHEDGTGIDVTFTDPDGAPRPRPRTAGQNRAYHGKCGTLARISGVPVREIKEWALEQASTTLHRDITTSKAMNEDEMSDVLDTLDAAITKAETEA